MEDVERCLFFEKEPLKSVRRALALGRVIGEVFGPLDNTLEKGEFVDCNTEEPHEDAKLVIQTSVIKAAWIPDDNHYQSRCLVALLIGTTGKETPSNRLSSRDYNFW